MLVDSSVLIALGKLGQLGILRQLGRSVYAPPRVRGEAAEDFPDAPAAAEIRGATWLKDRAPKAAATDMLRKFLHPGEAEVIALAIEIAAETDDYLLVLDDSRARRHAESHELRLTGTVGLLTQAKLSDLITELKPVLEDLRRHEFHITERLIARALAEVGES